MRRNELKKWLILVFALFLWEPTHAQGTEKKSLRSVLDQLEEQFAVRFSYMDQTIDSIQVKFQMDQSELEQILKDLESEVGLEFIKLSGNFISIRIQKTSLKICGYLLDRDDGSPVSDVHIFNQTTSTISDSNGYFELPNQAISSSILTSHVGYQNQSLSFDNMPGKCMKFYLTPLVNKLDEIIINNYLTRGIDKRESGEIIMDVQNTNILPGLTEPDIFFLLQNLPGIQSINETVTNINVRGGSNDQNLILWDGLRLYQTGHFFGLISAINPHIIGKSTLTKNGTPARLGEGVSGTIQVQTRSKSDNSDEITAHVGSNLINSDLMLDIPSDKLHLLIASRQSIGGAISTPTYD